jgi:hypothetical protein
VETAKIAVESCCILRQFLTPLPSIDLREIRGLKPSHVWAHQKMLTNKYNYISPGLIFRGLRCIINWDFRPVSSLVILSLHFIKNNFRSEEKWSKKCWEIIWRSQGIGKVDNCTFHVEYLPKIWQTAFPQGTTNKATFPRTLTYWVAILHPNVPYRYIWCTTEYHGTTEYQSYLFLI